MPPAVGGERLRFAAVGDSGLDAPAQRQLARHLHASCDGLCDFVLVLGDNFYEYGLDPDQLEVDTAKLSCMLGRYPGPKYVTLGNHDYHPILPSGTRGRAQVAFLARPDDDLHGGYHFYRFDTKLASFWALDTNYLVRGADPWTADAKLVGFGETIRAEDDSWKIVFGHHPMLSNGYHGNAGGFLENDFVSVWSGAAFRRFMLRYVVGQADLYLAGHEHNLQFYGRAFGSNTGFVVSGGAAKCTPRSTAPRNAEAAMLEHYGYGFVIVDVTREELVVRFYGYDGEELWGVRRGRRGRWTELAGFPKRLANLEPRCGEEKEALERADARAGGADCQLPGR
jgi:tartrate-resistant acid phosphatase type 5